VARTPVPFPSKEDILRFIAEQPGPVGRREIARAFGIRGAQRAELRGLLKELADEGHLDRGHRRRYGPPGELPAVAVLEITEADEDGTLYARPVSGDAPEQPPRIVLAGPPPRGPAMGPGDRLLARLARRGEGYEARTIRRLQAAPARIIGVYTEIAGEGRLAPTSRREKFDYLIPKRESGGAHDGELVAAQVVPGRRLGLREARVVERLGPLQGPRAASLIAIHENDIPDRFSDAALDEAKAARPVAPGGREDLRDLPLVTIDGADARDFDDAVWAAPDDAPGNADGWRVVVAIADVAHYVRPGNALDRDARLRGNSVYFPDRVVPMLPHELSSGLCSLRPDEMRAVLAVDMRFDRDGNKLGHRFRRGLMRSAARLTYEQAQDARDGKPNELPATLRDEVLTPLYGAWEALLRARNRREPLELEIPEMQVLLDDDGHVQAIRPRPRLDSHRLIEDFMIAANVCAAETLEQLHQPCMYRVHDEPDREKLHGLAEFLASVNLKLTLGEVVRPALFNRILGKARDSRHWEAVNQAILRSQAQAMYSPDNIGHFGLALRRYAHFTSPIRRYADLMVHRALIRGLKLGDDGLSDDEAERFHATGEHISNTERRAMMAERAANDRYVAAYLQERVGAEFAGRINGMSRAGLFVRLDETGADGLVPISTLGREYFRFDDTTMTLTGERTGRCYRLGDRVSIRLGEASALTGGLIFELLEDGGADDDGRRRRGRAAGRVKAKNGGRGGKGKRATKGRRR